MIEIIYNMPNWVLGIIIVSVTVIYADIGLILVSVLIPYKDRIDNNDVTASISAIAGIAYAIILAFIGIAAWEAFDEADSMVETEAVAAMNIWLGMRPYPKDYEIQVRAYVDQYIDYVINEEWVLQERGEVSMNATHTIEKLHRFLGDFRPETIAQQVEHQEMIKKINTLAAARRNRISINKAGINPLIYVLIVLGTMLVIAFSWFLGTPNFLAHLTLTSMLGISIGLILFLITAMDWPFRGEFSIGPDQFLEIHEELERLSIEQPPTEAK